MDEMKMETTCNACPLQIEGTIDDQPFYFRARGEFWSMGIGGDVVVSPLWAMSGPWGDGPFAAGWMPEHVGQAIVEKCAQLWRVARYSPSTADEPKEDTGS